MAFVSFPEPKDLNVPYEQMITDGKPLNFQQWTVENPHPGFGKDPNIINEYGHTKYPKWVGNVIVNSEEEEKALGNPPSDPVTPPAVGWGEPVKLKDDGPTVAEWVAAGYKADAYPPSGYSSKSTDEEIKTAIEVQVSTKWSTA